MSLKGFVKGLAFLAAGVASVIGVCLLLDAVFKEEKGQPGETPASPSHDGNSHLSDRRVNEDFSTAAKEPKKSLIHLKAPRGRIIIKGSPGDL